MTNIRSAHWTFSQCIPLLFNQYVVLINLSDQNGIQQWKRATLENEQHCQSLFFCILEEEKKNKKVLSANLPIVVCSIGTACLPDWFAFLVW